MDPLSDILSLLRPRSYITAGFDAGGPWAVRFDDQAGFIKCYVVTSGSCWLRVEGVDAPVRLQGGDCFVLPSGRSFWLGSDFDVAPMMAAEVFAPARRGGTIVHNGGGDVFLAGSRFAIEGRYAEALLRDLPPIIHLEARSDQDALRWSIERMMEEMREDRPGAALFAQHLAHLMLLQALRLYLSRQSGERTGWFFALADPQLASAIRAMHADPARRWTLDELAVQAGMSRSLFAQRFRERVGETPIAYLTRWRMTLAGDRLVTAPAPLAQTARALGYESENSFNTAFRRVMGCSPRKYARAHA